MRFSLYVVLLAAVLICATMSARCDERADTLLGQVEEALNNGETVLANYNVTITYQGRKWTQKAQANHPKPGSESLRLGPALPTDNLAPDTLPRMRYFFTPIFSSLSSCFDKETAQTQYIGAEMKNGESFAIVEIRHPISKEMNQRRGWIGDVSETIVERRSIGIDNRIHRMTATITQVSNAEKTEPRVFELEAVVTEYRKPRETVVSPRDYVAPNRTLETQGAKATWALAYSPDGKLLATGNEAGAVELWHTNSWKSYVLEGHTQPINSLAFSRDGKLLATVSVDKTLRLWNVETGTLMRIFSEDTSSISTVAFSPDGKMLVSAGLSKNVHVWDTATGKELHTLSGPEESIVRVAFSPNGKWLAAAGYDKNIRVWDTGSWQFAHLLTGHREPVFALAFSTDGKTLVSAGRDATIRVWNPVTGQSLRVLEGEFGQIHELAFSPDGKTLAATYDDKYEEEGSSHPGIKFWDTRNWRQTRTMTTENPDFSCLAFSPDGKNLVTAGGSKFVRFWNLPLAAK